MKLLLLPFIAMNMSWGAQQKSTAPAKAPAKIVRTEIALLPFEYNLEMPTVTAEKASESKRKPAAGEAVNAAKSAQYLELKKNVTACRTGDCLAKFIAQSNQLVTDKVGSEISALPLDAQFLHSTLSMLAPFRGLTYQMKPFMSSSSPKDLKLMDITDKLLARMELAVGEGFNQAVFEYLTIPTATSPIHRTVADLQKYLGQTVYPTLNATTLQIDRMSKVVGSNGYFVADFDLLMPQVNPSATMIGKIKDRRVGYVELSLMNSWIHENIHDLLWFAAYNWDDYLKYQEVAATWSFIRSAGDVLPTSSYTRVQTSKLPVYSEMGTLFQPALLTRALDHKKVSISLFGRAWQNLKGREFNEGYVFNFKKLEPLENALNDSIKLHSKIYFSKGEFVPVYSDISGDVVWINMPAIYGVDGQAPANLKSFLPVNWNKTAKSLPVPGKPGSTYINFRSGSPTGWSGTAYSPYLRFGAEKPAGNAKEINWLPSAVRVLRESKMGLSQTTFSLSKMVL
jgi:hypothetical protein